MHWNGSSFQLTTVPSADPQTSGFGDGNALRAASALASNDMWAGGEYFDGADHGLALHWNGRSWTEVAIPGGVSEFFAFASDDIYAAGSGIMHRDGVVNGSDLGILLGAWTG